MPRGARLRSIDAVDALAAALRRFEEEANRALTDLDLDVKRAVEWVSHDRKQYWTNEVRRGWDHVAEARAALERRIATRVSDERPSVIQEKKALAAAKRRLEVAQQKVEAVRRWTNVVAREQGEFQGIIGQLAAWIQGELPKATAGLDRMGMALEAYVGVPTATGVPDLPPSAARADSEGPAAAAAETATGVEGGDQPAERDKDAQGNQK